MKNDEFKPIYRYLITFGAGILFTFLALLVKDIFNLKNTVDILKAFCDATFVAGVLIVCAGGLVVAANGGTFDMLSYGVRQIFVLFRKDVTKRKYKDFYEYKEAKRGTKRGFLHLIIIGFVFIAISMIFLLLYYQYLPVE